MIHKQMRTVPCVCTLVIFISSLTLTIYIEMENEKPRVSGFVRTSTNCTADWNTGQGDTIDWYSAAAAKPYLVLHCSSRQAVDIFHLTFLQAGIRWSNRIGKLWTLAPLCATAAVLVSVLSSKQNNTAGSAQCNRKSAARSATAPQNNTAKTGPVQQVHGSVKQ